MCVIILDIKSISGRGFGSYTIKKIVKEMKSLMFFSMFCTRKVKNKTFQNGSSVYLELFLMRSKRRLNFTDILLREKRLKCCMMISWQG